MTDNTHAETPDQLLERLTLAAIERRAAAADGPWTLHGPDPESEWTVYDATGRLVAVVATVEEAMLIADAPVDISRLLAEVRRLEADLDRAVDWALEHRAAAAQARHQLARVTSRAEAAIRVLPGGTSARPLADQVADLAAEVRRLRADLEHARAVVAEADDE